jgi:hypothetical protein
MGRVRLVAVSVVLGGTFALYACSLITPVDDLFGKGDATSDASPSDAAGDAQPLSDSASDAGAPDTGPSCGRPGPTNGLVAYWPMDEGTGDTVHDCTSNHYDGKFLSQDPDGGSWTKGFAGGAVQVSGTHGCVDFGAPQGLRFQTAFSASAWVYVPTDPVDVSYVVGQTMAANISGWRISLDVGPVTNWEMGIEDAGNVSVSAMGPTAGKWTHIAGVWRPGGPVEVYVNGSAGAVEPNGVPMKVFEDVAHMRVGCRGDDSLYFPGAIDEVRLYSRALTLADISALAQ